VTFGIRLRKCGASQLVREDPHTLAMGTVASSFHRTRTMYLRTRLPASPSTYSLSATHSSMYTLQDIVLDTRSTIFHFVLPREVFVQNVYPWSRWDDTDQVFISSDNSILDSAGVRLGGLFKSTSAVGSEFSIMLYTSGWADHGSSGPFVALVPTSHADVKKLNDLLEYDSHTAILKESLNYYNIDISSSATISLANQMILKVECTSRLVRDETRCRYRFWRLEVHINESVLPHSSTDRVYEWPPTYSPYSRMG
jgi:hypothetical protein